MARKNKPVATKLDLSRKKTREFDVDTNIKVAYKTGKILYGKNQILKNLFRENPFKMLIMSNNCPSELMTQINHFNSLLKDKLFIHKYKGSSWDLGLACAKPYMISVMGIIDFGDSDLISLRTK
ncbi:MAG: 50S ribosomal protein L30e [Promethearchaeota archaeon Loki_b32]|nr:MAG: 50S ribosomal protein L30e [Candidatus Lokiarchaeota archaeon Loki_b32]